MQNMQLEPRPSSLSGLSRWVEGSAAWIMALVIVPGLLIAALLLPPISLLERLQMFTYTRISASGGSVGDPDGTVVNFPSEGINTSFYAAIQSTPRSDFIEGQAGRQLYDAANALPDHLIPKSPFYDLDVRGTQPKLVTMRIPIPNDSLPYETLSVYTWTGDQWVLVPSDLFAGEDIIESQLDYTPSNFMVMQTVASVPSVTVDLGIDAALPEGAVTTYDAKAGLYLRGDGAPTIAGWMRSPARVPISPTWSRG